MTLDDVQSLLDAPSPAVLTTYRRDSSALTTPVWFRFHEDAFEVVLAEGDVKRQHLERRRVVFWSFLRRYRPSAALRSRASRNWWTATSQTCERQSQVGISE